MKLNISKKNFKVSILVIILALVIFKYFNTPYNFYSILNWNYNERMEQNYGYCENESWGFYNFVLEKFKLENEKITIINKKGNVTLENLFNIKKNNFESLNYLILLNYISENDENINQAKLLKNKNFETIYRYNNCYLIKY